MSNGKKIIMDNLKISTTYDMYAVWAALHRIVPLAENSLRAALAQQISHEIELLIRFAFSWLRYRLGEAEGNEERKKFSHRSLCAMACPSPCSEMDGWIVIESHPRFTNGAGLTPPAKSLNRTCIFPFDTPRRTPDFIKNSRNPIFSARSHEE